MHVGDIGGIEVAIQDAQGKNEFRNCRLSDSNGGGYYEPADGAELSFVECNFGEMETNYWYFDV